MLTRVMFLVAATTWAAHSASADTGDWIQFGGPSRNFQWVDATDPTERDFAPWVVWQRDLGEGMSSVVVADSIAYATFLEPFSDEQQDLPESERSHREAVIALDLNTGETLWQHVYEAGWAAQQQSFGGRVRCPQSTPAILGNHLVTVGFTGLIHCFDRNNGRVLWKDDFVARFEAPHVQFGFAASPIVLGDQRVAILAGGQKGGLVCLDVRSGETSWNFACDEASYATPVIVTPNGDPQIVFVTRDDVIAVSQQTGEERWRYKLPKPGLTNVPTPLVTGPRTLVLSGQGIGGTQEIQLESVDGAWQVREGWFSQTQFFYCNWVEHAGQIVGCDGDLLVALDVRDGRRIGRWRGFNDSNIVVRGKQIWILHGNGDLSSLNRQQDQFNVLTRHQLGNERCWAPPALASRRMLARVGPTVVCVELNDRAREGQNVLGTRRIRQRKLAFQRATQGAGAEDIDAIELIVAAFEQEGAQGALRVYSRLREQGNLNRDDRDHLLDLAEAQGLAAFAAKIRADIAQDFPN